MMSRAQAVSYLQNDLMQNGFNITKTANIPNEEIPDVLRHSCKYTGITYLDMVSYEVYDEKQDTAGVLPYFFCTECGKLYLGAHIEGFGGY